MVASEAHLDTLSAVVALAVSARHLLLAALLVHPTCASPATERGNQNAQVHALKSLLSHCH